MDKNVVWSILTQEKEIQSGLPIKQLDKEVVDLKNIENQNQGLISETADLERQNFPEDVDFSEAGEGAGRVKNTTVESSLDNADSDGDAYSIRAADIDLNVLLARDSEELNRELDRVDERIVVERKSAQDFERKMDSDTQALKKRMAKRAEERIRNKDRANIVSQIGSEEIRMLAKSSLPKIEEDEKSKTLTYRRKLYSGSNGEQQSLLYKQVWDPFLDEQHGKRKFYLLLLLFLVILDFRSCYQSPD